MHRPKPSSSVSSSSLNKPAKQWQPPKTERNPKNALDESAQTPHAASAAGAYLHESDEFDDSGQSTNGHATDSYGNEPDPYHVSCKRHGPLTPYAFNEREAFYSCFLPACGNITAEHEPCTIGHRTAEFTDQAIRIELEEQEVLCRAPVEGRGRFTKSAASSSEDLNIPPPPQNPRDESRVCDRHGPIPLRWSRKRGRYFVSCKGNNQEDLQTLNDLPCTIGFMWRGEEEHRHRSNAWRAKNASDIASRCQCAKHLLTEGIVAPGERTLTCPQHGDLLTAVKMGRQQNGQSRSYHACANARGGDLSEPCIELFWDCNAVRNSIYTIKTALNRLPILYAEKRCFRPCPLHGNIPARRNGPSMTQAGHKCIETGCAFGDKVSICELLCKPEGKPLDPPDLPKLDAARACCIVCPLHARALPATKHLASGKWKHLCHAGCMYTADCDPNGACASINDASQERKESSPFFTPDLWNVIASNYFQVFQQTTEHQEKMHCASGFCPKCRLNIFLETTENVTHCPYSTCRVSFLEIMQSTMASQPLMCSFAAASSTASTGPRVAPTRPVNGSAQGKHLPARPRPSSSAASASTDDPRESEGFSKRPRVEFSDDDF